MTTRTFSLLTIALSFALLTAYGAENGVAIDQNTSVEVLRTEAERNNPVAQWALGERYYNGDGITQDKAEAVKWFRKAAEQGYANAQYALGICYETGDGVVQNKTEAVKWLQKAAEQGFAPAQQDIEKLQSQKAKPDKQEAVNNAISKMGAGVVPQIFASLIGTILGAGCVCLSTQWICHIRLSDWRAFTYCFLSSFVAWLAMWGIVIIRLSLWGPAGEGSITSFVSGLHYVMILQTLLIIAILTCILSFSIKNEQGKSIGLWKGFLVTTASAAVIAVLIGAIVGCFIGLASS